MDAQSHALELPLTEGGALVLKRDGRDVAQWALTLTPDAPPRVTWDPGPARAGRGLGLRLPWKAEDDWGLVALRLELRLKQRPSAPPVTQDIPVPGGARSMIFPRIPGPGWKWKRGFSRVMARNRKANPKARFWSCRNGAFPTLSRSN
jgi:hypothetical protein